MTEKCNLFCKVITAINSETLACDVTRTWSRAKKNFKWKQLHDPKMFVISF